jgi:putative membrane protein
MTTPTTPAEPDVRDYFAAERTLLAYVRTGVAMMGIGFVVARFSLMLRMLPAQASTGVHHEPSGHSLWLGTALVLVGTVIMGLAGGQYWHRVKMLNALRSHGPIQASWLAIGLSLMAGVSGIAMAVYLVTNTQVPN